MILIQTINPLIERYIAIDSDVIIRNSDQKKMSEISQSNLLTYFQAVNLKDKSIIGFPLTFSYDVLTDYWFAELNSDVLDTMLQNQGKYVARVVHNASPQVFRAFKINEFGIYCDNMENTLCQLPYEIIVTQDDCKMVWYEPGYIGTPDRKLYEAPLYRDGVGVNYARNTSEVTHRGDLKFLKDV